MKIEQVRTTGWGLDNNVWLWGDEDKLIIIDAAHDAKAILDKVGQRQVEAVLFTHAHPDHINAAAELKTATKAPMYLHPLDRFMWDKFADSLKVDYELAHDQILTFGNHKLQVLHTPGHTPGGVCFYWPAGRTLFSGDTLFPGGPGATRWEYSSFEQIIDSIKTRLFTLPDETKVLAGHGRPTTIGEEKPHLKEWLRRGY